MGHAAPVRCVRWAPPSLGGDEADYLASCGCDGVLCVWDHLCVVPQRQRHIVAQNCWALDLVWSPSVEEPAILVATDTSTLRVQSLNSSTMTTVSTAAPVSTSSTAWSAASIAADAFRGLTRSDAARLPLVREAPPA